MKSERLQEIIDLAHADRNNPMSEALIEMIDAYMDIETILCLQAIKDFKE